LGYLRDFVEQFYTVVPGLTIGPTTPVPLSDPQEYVPDDSGEREGELYLSNDRNPHLLWIWTDTGWVGLTGAASGSTIGAPVYSKYLLNQPDVGLPNAQAISALATGVLKGTTITGAVSIAGLTDYGTGTPTAYNFLRGDGTWNGPADPWDDLQVTATNAVGGAALSTQTFRDTNASMLCFPDAGTSYITFYAQMPHKWNIATSVRPHIHWVPRIAVSAPSTVIFTGRYVWAIPNGVIPANASWTPFTVTVNLVPGDEYKALITSIAVVPPPSPAAPSDILIVALGRDATTDTYNDGANNVGILSLDVHYQINRFGTVTEFA
jgi:hypothetical protein